MSGAHQDFSDSGQLGENPSGHLAIPVGPAVAEERKMELEESYGGSQKGKAVAPAVLAVQVGPVGTGSTRADRATGQDFLPRAKKVAGKVKSYAAVAGKKVLAYQFLLKFKEEIPFEKVVLKVSSLTTLRSFNIKELSPLSYQVNCPSWCGSSLEDCFKTGLKDVLEEKAVSVYGWIEDPDLSNCVFPAKAIKPGIFVFAVPPSAVKEILSSGIVLGNTVVMVSEKRPEIKPVCLNCGSLDHYIKACPSIKCFKCNQRGHFRKQCPSLTEKKVFTSSPGKVVSSQKITKGSAPVVVVKDPVLKEPDVSHPSASPVVEAPPAVCSICPADLDEELTVSVDDVFLPAGSVLPTLSQRKEDSEVGGLSQALDAFSISASSGVSGPSSSSRQKKKEPVGYVEDFSTVYAGCVSCIREYTFSHQFFGHFTQKDCVDHIFQCNGCGAKELGCKVNFHDICHHLATCRPELIPADPVKREKLQKGLVGWEQLQAKARKSSQ